MSSGSDGVVDDLEMRDPRLHVDEVDQTLAQDLVRDVRSVQGLRVSGLRDVHGPIFASGASVPQTARAAPTSPRRWPTAPGRVDL